MRADMSSVYSEISNVLVPRVIPRTDGAEFKAKKVRRNYTFDDTVVPREVSEYIKVKYSSKYPAPQLKFARVASTTSASLGHPTVVWTCSCSRGESWARPG